MTGSMNLPRGEAHTWCVTLDIPFDRCVALYATLSEDERSRSARFRFERDRQRFIVARGALREVLGGYLGIEPRHLRFVYNAFGKPALSPEFGSSLKFNLSHSGGCALVAIATGAEIGVDLEYIWEQPDQAGIAQRFFSVADIAQLNRLPSHLKTQGFFSCWTRHEAYAKARGEGLDGSPAAPARQWSFYTIQPAPGYIGALVVERSGWCLRQGHWSGVPLLTKEQFVLQPA